MLGLMGSIEQTEDEDLVVGSTIGKRVEVVAISRCEDGNLRWGMNREILVFLFSLFLF